MIRILHIIGSLERAGIETFVMNLYRVIDRNKIQFDFAIYNPPSENSYAEEVLKYGGRIYILPPKNKGLIKNLREIKRIVNEGKYIVVWRGCSNCFGGFDLFAAKIGGARERILHAHASREQGLLLVLHYIFRPISNCVATRRLSCGEKAGKWMFGNRMYEIMHNGICVKEFEYNSKVESEQREKLGLENKYILGHIGRFDNNKNQLFLIDVFNDYHKKCSKSVLIFIGDGPNRKKCMDYVYQLGLEKDVLFLGTCNNISILIQAINVLVMPSKYEGFPMTLVEAQAAGIPCVVSDSISKETNICGGVSFISLHEAPEKWSETIQKINDRKMAGESRKIKEAGYDVLDTSKVLERWIINECTV